MVDRNTFIWNGPLGYLFEVTPDGTTVWSHKAAPEIRIFRATRAFTDRSDGWTY